MWGFKIKSLSTLLNTIPVTPQIYACMGRRLFCASNCDFRNNRSNAPPQASPPMINKDAEVSKSVSVENKVYLSDEWTNITPKIMDMMKKKLHLQKDHPICLIKQVIIQHFYKSYKKRGNSIFAVFDDLSPVVTTKQNFDDLLIPKDHVSRRKSDNYYINKNYMLRAHTSAHEHDLIKSGLNAYLTIGDVYRRDAIDSTHFPAFHQLEGVKLFNCHELFSTSDDPEDLSLFENGEELHDKQACHTLEASKLVEYHLKKAIEDCMAELFGQAMEYRWIKAYFPFTHPSFELEIKYNDEWVEMLGCGILRQEILNAAGAQDNVAWAFGLGLERLAMKLFGIPDIRYFWSTDESVQSQFRDHDDIKSIKFKPLISNHPAVHNDISFWVPDGFCSNDFFDLVRSVNSEIVENIAVVDEFRHPKTGRNSFCYRIYYRHTLRVLTQTEVSKVHSAIKEAAVRQLAVEGRW